MSLKDEENIYKEYFNPDMFEAYQNKFIKIPCEFFSYLQLDNKLILTLISLFKRKTIYNTITVCLKNIIEENNYIPAKGKNRSVEQFRDSLFNLIKLELVEFFSDKLQNIVKEQLEFEKQNNKKSVQYIPEYEKLINSINATTIIALKFNEEKIKLLTTNNFTILDFNVIISLKKICENNSSVKMANLINTYILLKKHIEANKHFSNEDWNISINLLSNTLKLSEKTIIEAIKILESNQIIFVKRKDGKNYYSLSKEKRAKGILSQKAKKVP